ncbi:MAG: prepilin peptidase [Phycisphaerae bacterium]
MTHTRELLTFVPLAVALVWAAAVDVRARRIPNWLTLPLAVAGLLAAGLGYVPVTAGQAWVGAGVGFGLAFAMMAIGAMGGGDVKLMMAIGAWVGGPRVLLIFAAAAVVGMLLAIAQAVVTGRLGELVRGSAALAARAAVTRDVTCPDGLGLSDAPGCADALGRKPVPFAVPALVGTVLILFLGAWR